MKTPKELAEEYVHAWWGPREDNMTLATRQSFLAGYQAGFKEAKKYWANQPKYDADPIEKLIEDKFWEQPKPKVKL